jgi:hypothetical protein
MTGCPSSEETREAVEEQPAPIQGVEPMNLPEDRVSDETEDESEPADYEGTDLTGFVETWVSLGESERDLRLRLNLYEEINLLLFIEWHIAMISDTEAEEYARDFQRGDYIIQALGGRGIDQLDLYISDPESDTEAYIAYDDQENNVPKIEHTFEEADSVTLLFDPVIFEEGYHSAWYCWFVMKQE